jgi:hypothetical protein
MCLGVQRVATTVEPCSIGRHFATQGSEFTLRSNPSALADLAAIAAAALRAEEKYRNSIAVADEAHGEVATRVENRKQKLERTRERRGLDWVHEADMRGTKVKMRSRKPVDCFRKLAV